MKLNFWKTNLLDPNQTTKKLAGHLQRGIQAEQTALNFLESNGLKLVMRNFRCAGGELDMIMFDERELVFVEVRYRNSEQFGGAAISVDRNKQLKLKKASETFLQTHAISYTGCRFDVVALSGGSPNYKIDWIRDAF